MFLSLTSIEKETIFSNSKSDIRIRDAQSTQQCRIDKESYIIPRPHNCIIMMRGGKGKKNLFEIENNLFSKFEILSDCHYATFFPTLI